MIAQIENKIKLLLKQIAEEQGFKQYNLNIKSITTDGANYSSTLYLAKIQENDNDLDLFVKVAAMGNKMREKFDLKIYFIEQYIYTKLKKAFHDLEETHNVPEADRFVLPAYYGSDLSKEEEILVLEDLTARGFSSYDRLKSIDWPYASASVTQLARFHALGMAFEHEKPEEYAKTTKDIEFDWLNPEMMDVFWQAGFDKTFKVVKEEYKEKLTKFLADVNIRGVKDMYQPVRKACIAHNDYRASNLMHRHRGDGTVEIIPVDYQIVQIGCQVIDLLYFIFSGSDQEFRKQYFTKLVDLYYEQLSAALTKLGLDSKATYSRDDFDTEFQEKLPCGLVLATFTLPIVTVDTENAPDVDGFEVEKFTGYKTSELFVERINGVIEDMIAWGVL